MFNVQINHSCIIHFFILITEFLPLTIVYGKDCIIPSNTVRLYNHVDFNRGVVSRGERLIYFYNTIQERKTQS